MQANSNMIKIPATSYIYRTSHRIMEGDCQYDHGPRAVDLQEFLIDIYPVTNADFKAFLDDFGYASKNRTNFLKHWGGDAPSAEILNHPVVWVSLQDAQEYAKWRGCRLPKEEEWQLAAGGLDKFAYPWGNEYNANFCNSSGDSLTAVDAFAQGKSPFGLMDMCGNAWEFTNDIIDDGMNLFALLRGGSYYQADHFWHTDGGPRPNTHHLKMPLIGDELNRAATVGFRCVKERE